MNVDTARAISEVGKTLLDSAKVEIEYMKLTDASKSQSELLSAVGAPVEKQLPPSTRSEREVLGHIGERYGKAQGVYYELKNGDVDPVSLETIAERIGHAGLKSVPQYLSLSELKEKLIPR